MTGVVHQINRHFLQV